MVENHLRTSPQTVAAGNSMSADEPSYDIKLGTVLQDVYDAGLPGESMFYLKSADGEVRGWLLLRDSQFIIAALNRETTGFDAVKELFTVRRGSYKWSHNEDDVERNVEYNLNIDLASVIPTLPWLSEKKLDEKAKIKKPARSYSTLHAIKAMPRKEDEPIKLPKHLRERLVHGVSLAHTVERNFETVSSINSKRLENRGRSFEAAKNDSILVPIYVCIGILMVMTAALVEWAVLAHVFKNPVQPVQSPQAQAQTPAAAPVHHHLHHAK